MSHVLHARIINLMKWFPANDPVAASIARLCILREDFYLECQGIAAEEIPALDSNGELWRRLYFVRGVLRTLEEAQGALMIIKQDHAFKRAMEKDTNLRNAISNFETAIKAPEVKELRNRVSAHILYQDVYKMLAELEPDDEGMLVSGDKHKGTHYKFAVNLLVGLMLYDVPKAERPKRFETVGDAVLLAQLMDAVSGIITAYAESRGLAKLTEHKRHF